MAVVTSTGVVGLVKEVSTNFCTVMSLLHSKIIISSKIKKNGFFGPLSWEGKSFSYATLDDIPAHVKLTKGDTIVTSAYSLAFPENIMVLPQKVWMDFRGMARVSESEARRTRGNPVGTISRPVPGRLAPVKQADAQGDSRSGIAKKGDIGLKTRPGSFAASIPIHRFW